MDTGTAAAAAGGVTTVVDMPLNSEPCTVTGDLVRQKMELARKKSRVNIGFWGGLVPDNADKHDVLQVAQPPSYIVYDSMLCHSYR